jgi:Virulence-associated protein E
MTDFLTILKSRGPLMTKRWTSTGIKPYDRAKNFSVRENAVSDIHDLARALTGIADQPDQCVIRGAFIDDQRDASRDQTTRDLEHFREVPHQWVCLDVDNFVPVLADPVSEPSEAVGEFIETQLPLEFTDRSYYWQLSSSAGAPGKEQYLKAHIWFFLSEPVFGSLLEVWARHGSLPVDKTVFRTVQIHYTANPVIDAGVVCPVAQRSGFVQGALDEVTLVVAEGIDTYEPEERRAARSLSDPGLKTGVIGAFCRAYSPHRVIDELLPHLFEYEDEDNVRVTWHGGGGSPGGCCVTDDELHFFNGHDSDPNGGRAVNAWDMCRIYMFGHLDGDDPSVYEFAGPGALPSHAAMRDYARGLPDVQASLMDAVMSPQEHIDPPNVLLRAPGASVSEIEEQPTDLDRALAAIERCHVVGDLETRLAANLRDADWLDTERAQVVHALQARAQALTGTRLPVATVRGWMTPPVGAGGWTDVTAQGRVLGTEGNVREVLRQLGATVRYNTMAKEDEVLLPGQGFTVDNRANVTLGKVLSACNAVDMKIQVGTLKTFVNIIAEGNQYNPPLEWITSVAWDGVDRLPSWYATVTTTPDKERLKAILMRRWALQCVALLFNTGATSSRGVLTLTGVQYAGKSRWLKSLAPEGMVQIGLLLDVHDKDKVKKAVRYWITELGELDGTFKKSDMAALKAFLTNFDDELRLPYAPSESKFPRRTAFAATVNKTDLLRDPTGNTRFWMFEALDIDPDHGIDMQQLWAQILLLWNNGAEPHWLLPDEMKLLNDSNEDFTETDQLDEMVRTKLGWADPEAVWQWSTASQIATLIGAQNDRSAVSRMGGIVRKLNGGQVRRQAGTGVRLLRIPVAEAFS